MKYTLLTLSLLLTFHFTSCGDSEEDQLLGKYTLTQLEFSNCIDPDEVMFEFNNGGLCAEEDGVYACLFFCLTFSETELTVDLRATEDGNEIFNLSQAASYDPESESIDFCLPGNDCDGITVSNNKDRITFSGYDDDLECDFTFVMERS